MNKPSVSVVIPAYNGEKFLGEAIQSVLNQTYPDFEVLVVDDHSPDDIGAVVKSFSDPRIKYLRHQKNLGAVAARRTGVHSSSGEIIAFLDQDDLFHRNKLEAHVKFLKSHPDIGVSYNSRFQIRDSLNTICGLWHPPDLITLADLVTGFPISPSDTVIRRSWALSDEIWEHSPLREAGRVIFNGQEIVFGGRLALAGCRFAGIRRALNYRRYHTNRHFTHLNTRCQAELACQEMVFSDPRCPSEVLRLRKPAFANILLMWTCHAMAQNELSMAQQLLKSAIELNPALLSGKPYELISLLTSSLIQTPETDHENLLRNFFASPPPELQQLSRECNKAIAYGYLLKGIHRLIWDQEGDSHGLICRAAELQAQVDEFFLQSLVCQLLEFANEFGNDSVERTINRILPCLQLVDKGVARRKLRASYWISHAFKCYQVGDHTQALKAIVKGVKNQPAYLFNRGVLAITVRSFKRRIQ